MVIKAEMADFHIASGCLIYKCNISLKSFGISFNSQILTCRQARQNVMRCGIFLHFLVFHFCHVSQDVPVVPDRIQRSESRAPLRSPVGLWTAARPGCGSELWSPLQMMSRLLTRRGEDILQREWWFVCTHWPAWFNQQQLLLIKRRKVFSSCRIRFSQQMRNMGHGNRLISAGKNHSQGLTANSLVLPMEWHGWQTQCAGWTSDRIKEMNYWSRAVDDNTFPRGALFTTRGNGNEWTN